MFMSRQNHTRHLENRRLPDINPYFSGVPHISLVWSAEQTQILHQLISFQ
jgi:hypothetical protein